MTQYINKDTLVAEIKRLLNKYISVNTFNYSVHQDLINLLSFINTLEVKEVDLEEELNNWRHNHFHGRRNKDADGEYLERISQFDLAKYFFELGMQQSITKEQMYVSDVLTGVKSFKSQSHWKPSVKQIKVLKTAIRHTLEGSIDRHELESLYNDLKKL